MGAQSNMDRRKFLVAGSGVFTVGGLLAACGDNSSTTTGSTKASAGTRSGSGVPTPVALNKAPTAAFDPNVKPGLKPKLPRRIAWSVPAGGELFTRFDDAVREAAKSHGLEYITSQANGDSPKQFQQTEALLARGVGALVILDLAPPALVPLQLKAIKAGIPVFCGPFADSTCQLTADQAKIGRAGGVAAVNWVKEHLGGKAEAALFNIDTTPSQKPKSQAVRDALKAGGIKLVADVGVKTQDADEGFKLTNTILQRHPNVTLWLGNDGPLAGTLAALKAAGKAGDSKQALFGFGDGEAQALDAIAKGGPYKSTQGIAYSPIAYAWGKYAADYLDGKSIPLVMSVEPFEINSKATVDLFNGLQHAAAKGFTENETTHKYFTPLGNTSYENNRYLTVVA